MKDQQCTFLYPFVDEGEQGHSHTALVLGEAYHPATIQNSFRTRNFRLKTQNFLVSFCCNKTLFQRINGKKPIVDSIFSRFFIYEHTLITNLDKWRLNSIKIQLWGPRLDLGFAFWSLYFSISAVVAIQFLPRTAGLRMCRESLEPSGLGLQYF